MTAVVLVAMALLVNLDTFSWFNARAEGGIKVRADTTKDIISKFDVDNQNPEEIVIQKAGSLDYEPVVYFSVSDDAADYVLHINPYKLEDNNEHSIKIRTDVNLLQYIDLLCHKNKVINGTITLKHMNEYIIESKDIVYTREYLMDRFWEQIDSIGSEKNNTTLDKEDKGNIVILILYLANLIDWDRVFDIDNKPKVMGLAVSGEPMSDSAVIIPNMEKIMNPIPELSISDDQANIVEVVVPGLLEYINRLYDYTEELINQLNEKIEAISLLNLDIENLNNANTILEQEKAALTEENNQLKENVEELEDINKKLNDKVDSLEDEVSNLRARNERLEDENEHLRDEISGLNQELNDSRSQMPVKNPVTGGPPVEEEPPAADETPVIESPPIEEQPEEEAPGIDRPPAADNSPIDEPPVIEEPPIGEPTAEESPIKEPPAEPPIVDEPPDEETPVEEPLLSDEPYITDVPPVVVEPPVQNPPDYEPPVAEEPSEEDTQVIVEPPHEQQIEGNNTGIEASTNAIYENNGNQSEVQNGQAEDGNLLTSSQNDDQTNEGYEQEVIQENNTGPPIT